MRRLRLLHWTTAAVLGFAAGSVLARAAHGGGSRAHLALPVPVGAVELAGALLFVVPATVRVGGALLLLALFTAAAAHAAMGEVPPLAYPVYAAAVWTVLREERRGRIPA